jgi:hypothetical protein
MNEVGNKPCVYTVLLGDYEILNEQPVAQESQIDFICFTDNRNIRSNSWTFRYIEPAFPLDLARSSRVPKICPHRYLKEYDRSLYIDNSVILKKTPEIIFQELMEGRNVDMVLLNHSYRDTVLDEFIAVEANRLDDLNTIFEQLNSYQLTDPDVLLEKPLKGGFLLRNHMCGNVVDTMEEWLAQVLRYSRRDQLSLNYALRKKRPNMLALDIDIRNSDYFQWPVIRGRNRENNHPKFILSLLMDKVTKQEGIIHDLEKQLAEINGSRAWRFIQPLRRLRFWLKARWL